MRSRHSGAGASRASPGTGNGSRRRIPRARSTSPGPASAPALFALAETVVERPPVGGRSFGHVEERGAPAVGGQPPGGVGGGGRLPQGHVVTPHRRASGWALRQAAKRSEAAKVSPIRLPGTERRRCARRARPALPPKGRPAIPRPATPPVRWRRSPRARRGSAPVLGQIDRHRGPRTARLPPLGADHPLLELDDIGQVELPEAGALRARSTGRHGNRARLPGSPLGGTAGAGVEHHVIEKAGPHGDPRGQPAATSLPHPRSSGRSGPGANRRRPVRNRRRKGRRRAGRAAHSRRPGWRRRRSPSAPRAGRTTTARPGTPAKMAAPADSSTHPFHADCRSVPVSKKLSRYSSVPSSLSRTSEKTSAPLGGVTREQAYLGQVEVLELVGLGVDGGLRLGEGDRIVEAVRAPKGHPLLVDEPLAAWSSEQASDRVPLRSGRVFGHFARVDRDSHAPGPGYWLTGRPHLIERIV
jgi:hypothetical protein